VPGYSKKIESAIQNGSLPLSNAVIAHNRFSGFKEEVDIKPRIVFDRETQELLAELSKLTNKDELQALKQAIKCEYRFKNGERCQKINQLHLDQVIPFGKAGKNSADNQRLLWAKKDGRVFFIMPELF